MRKPCGLVLGFIFSLNWAAADDANSPMNWPQFRGSDSMGVVDTKGLPDRWSTTENVVWKTDIPGRGWSCPVVWGNKVFLTSSVSEKNMEEVRKGLYFGGERPQPPDATYHWITYCLDFDTGKVIWEKTAHKSKPAKGIHIKNSYATETPVTDGERVYIYFGNVGVFCYDMDGKLLWKKMLEPVKIRNTWGTAASPVLHDDRLFIVNDNDEQSYMLALNAKTGEEIWKVDREEGSNWATPFVWEHDLRTEIVTPGSDAVRSYDLDGKLLWQLKGMSVIAIPTPFTKFGLLYIASGYVLDRHKPIYAIRPGASGDISLKDGETSNEYIAWYNAKAGPYNPTPILYKEKFYVLLDRGFITCHDAKTGEEIYGRQRVARSTSGFTVSPWAYDGKIFCLDEDGVTYVVQAGPEFKLLHTNKLDELCMSTPAIARKSLFIRTATKLYRIANTDTTAKK